ncbi:MAG: ABC transporter ATP-binding protein [Thermoproteota archaeon]
MVSVRLENLTKYFGKVRAVEKINLTINDGEFLTFLGPSGCGKTTILRCIAGLESPTSGLIYFDDKVVNDLSPRERNVAMVFQSYALYPHMTVYDNIAFPLVVRKTPKDEIDRRVKEMAEFLHIEKILDRKPSEISGGERQRVALGRALIRKPTVFLMDEPLSNLDAKLRIYMRAELKALHRELGITTIYVTHDQVEAMTMSDRIALLNEGILQQVATPDELYYRPANVFTGSFIGSPPMNMTDAKLVEKDNRLYVDAAHFSLDVTEFKSLLASHIGDEVIFGVRPEDISLHEAPGEGLIKARVYVAEPLGGKAIVSLHIGDILFKVETTETWKPEDTVWISINKKKIHLFDKKTGTLIV